MSAQIVLSADRATRRFGDFTAVDNVSLQVRAGEVVGLLGANGAGKTTVMRMLLGLLPVSSGSVRLLDGPPGRERRRSIGYVPQNLGLYRDLTVRENLAFVARAYGTPVPVLHKEVAPYADRLVGQLPLGAQRRAAFAAALSHDPAAVLLDEPTSGVDALARARLWDTIRDQSDAGVGVLVTTHYMQEAQQCDRLLLMSRGRLVAQGTEADIIDGATAVAVHCEDWTRAFDALSGAGLAATLDGRAVRVVAAAPDRVRDVLRDAGVSAELTQVPATIEERMLLLDRDFADTR